MNICSISPQELFSSAFFTIPKEVYEGDELWHKENPHVIAWMFSDANPYFKNIKTNIWEVDTTCRLAGFFNPTLLIDGQKVAFFGYWETHNNQEANQQLFATFEQWAKEQGAAKVFGPINMTTYGSYRIQLEPTQRTPFFGEPYNPIYYKTILEQCGYSIFMNYHSVIGHGDHIQVGAQATPMFEAQLKKNNLKVVPLTPDLWMERQEEIHSIFQALWQNNFGFVPIDLHTFQTFFSRTTAEQLDPDVSIAVLDTDNKIAAYLAVYPDYGPIMNTLSSSPTFARDFPLLTGPAMLQKTGCVHPKYRKQHLFTAISVIACGKAVEKGYKNVVGCLIRSDNHSGKMDDFVKRIKPDATITKPTYGLFSKSL